MAKETDPFWGAQFPSPASALLNSLLDDNMGYESGPEAQNPSHDATVHGMPAGLPGSGTSVEVCPYSSPPR